MIRFSKIIIIILYFLTTKVYAQSGYKYYDLNIEGNFHNVWYYEEINSFIILSIDKSKNQPILYLADTLFQIKASYKKFGKGPGEITDVTSIYFNGNFNVMDYALNKVIVLDKNLHYVSESLSENYINDFLIQKDDGIIYYYPYGYRFKDKVAEIVKTNNEGEIIGALSTHYSSVEFQKLREVEEKNRRILFRNQHVLIDQNIYGLLFFCQCVFKLNPNSETLQVLKIENEKRSDMLNKVINWNILKIGSATRGIWVLYGTIHGPYYRVVIYDIYLDSIVSDNEFRLLNNHNTSSVFLFNNYIYYVAFNISEENFGYKVIRTPKKVL